MKKPLQCVAILYYSQLTDGVIKFSRYHLSNSLKTPSISKGLDTDEQSSAVPEFYCRNSSCIQGRFPVISRILVKIGDHLMQLMSKVNWQ